MNTLLIAFTVAAIGLLPVLGDQAPADPGPALPQQAAGTGTTHGVILPGVVELKGNAAWPQQPVQPPQAAEEPAAPVAGNTTQASPAARSAVMPEQPTQVSVQLADWRAYEQSRMCRSPNPSSSDR